MHKSHLCPLRGHQALPSASAHRLPATQPAVPRAGQSSSSQLWPQPRSLLHYVPGTDPVTGPVLSMVTLGQLTHPPHLLLPGSCQKRTGQQGELDEEQAALPAP